MRRLLCGTAVLIALTMAATAAEDARLDNVRKEWQNAYGAIIYTVLADVVNTSDHPLQYVKVKVTLVDKNGVPVAERVGYNVGAERLGDESPGSFADKLKRVQPIAPHGADLFRLSFDKPEIGKPFRSVSVSVVETR